MGNAPKRPVRRSDVTRRLWNLAVGKVNDCVRLVMEEDPEQGKLDLSLLSEVKRNEKGAVEIRLIDRVKVLEQLAGMMETDGTELEGLLRAMQDSGTG